MRYSCLCADKLPQRKWSRQAGVTHRLHSLASLREATRTPVRFDVNAEPPHGLRAAASVDNARAQLPGEAMSVFLGCLIAPWKCQTRKYDECSGAST